MRDLIGTLEIVSSPFLSIKTTTTLGFAPLSLRCSMTSMMVVPAVITSSTITQFLPVTDPKFPLRTLHKITYATPLFLGLSV